MSLAQTKKYFSSGLINIFYYSSFSTLILLVSAQSFILVGLSEVMVMKNHPKCLLIKHVFMSLHVTITIT